MFKDSGVPTRKFHCIRHSVATLLIYNGASPKQVQHQLGHATAQFTLDIYTQIVKEGRAMTPVLTIQMF